MGEEAPDGNIAWDGGMDASRFPDLINPNQYSRACNFMLPRNGGGIKTRGGYHHIKLDFGTDTTIKELFETGHVQAEGWFRSGAEEFLVVCISGHVFRLAEITKYSYKPELVNKEDLLDVDAERIYINRVPEAVIVNDGKSCPLIVTKNLARRSKGPDEGEIGCGLMGVYVQNRYFQVSADRKFITPSNFLNPFSITEGDVYNIQGFRVPEDEDDITAIGKQKSLISYVEVGVLAFATADSIYSVDVRGDRGNWEEGSLGVGKIQQSIPSLGASSAYSFEPFNTNLYFRTMEHGVADFKQSQYQFVNEGDTTDQSIEVGNWLDHDTKWMLKKCYTRGYRSRLFTTTSPERREDGHIFWNGMISHHPTPVYSNQQRAPRRFEGAISGIRPWAITVAKGITGKQRMFVYSYDKDGINRLYKYEEESTFDVNHNGSRVEIESWLETRGMNHNAPNAPKTPTMRYYKLRDLYRTANVKAFTKTESSGAWKLFSDLTHLVGHKDGSGLRGVMNRTAESPQGRDLVMLDKEPDNDSETYSSLAGVDYYIRQDRLEIKGHVILDKMVRHANFGASSTSTEIEDKELINEEGHRPDFGYSIATSIPNV